MKFAELKNSPGRPTITKVVALAVVVLILVLVIIASYAHRQGKVSNSAEAPESGKQTETELRGYKHQVTVDVTANGPLPQTLNIPRDTRVNWENKDSVAHKLAITPGTTVPPEFDNFHLIDVGGGYPYVIHQPVTFHYYLVDRPTQGGVVIVK